MNNPFLPKRSIFAGPYTPEGDSAEKFKQLENLNNPSLVDKSSNPEALMEFAESVLNMKDKEFCRLYGHEYPDASGSPLTYVPYPGGAAGTPAMTAYIINQSQISKAKADKSQKLEEQADKVIGDQFSADLSELEREGDPRVKEILKEAQDFFDASSVGLKKIFPNEAERKLFEETLKKHGLTEKELIEKGRTADELAERREDYEMKKTALEAVKLELEQLKDDREKIDQLHEMNTFTRWATTAGVVAATGVAAGFSVGLSLGAWPVAITLGVSTISKHVLQEALWGSKVLNAIKRFGMHLPYLGSLAQAESAEKLSSIEHQSVEKAMGRLKKKEELYKAQPERRLEKLKKSREENELKMKRVKRDIRKLKATKTTPPTTEYTRKMTALKNRQVELVSDRQLIDRGIERLEKVMVRYKLSEEKAEDLVTYDASGKEQLNDVVLDEITRDDYLPGTGKALKDYLQQDVSESRAAQETIGEMSPQTIITSLTQLNVKQRRLLLDTRGAGSGFLESLPDTKPVKAKKEALLGPLEPLQRSAKPVYDLCVQILELPKSNPFRKEAETLMKETIIDLQSEVEGLGGLKNTLDDLLTTDFNDRFSKRFIDKEALFKKKGLARLAERVLGSGNALTRYLDHEDLSGAKVKDLIAGTNVTGIPPTGGFSAEQSRDLMQVLKAIETKDSGGVDHLPKYIIDENGAIQAYESVLSDERQEVQRLFQGLPAQMRKALDQKPNQIQELAKYVESTSYWSKFPFEDPNDVDNAIPYPRHYKDFMSYLSDCDHHQLSMVQKTLRVMPQDMMVLEDGISLQSKWVHEVNKTRRVLRAVDISQPYTREMVQYILQKPRKHIPKVMEALGKEGLMGIRLIRSLDALPDRKYTSMEDFLSVYESHDEASTEDLKIIREVFERVNKNALIVVPLKEFRSLDTALAASPQDYLIRTVDGIERMMEEDIHTIFSHISSGTNFSDLTGIDHFPSTSNLLTNAFSIQGAAGKSFEFDGKNLSFGGKSLKDPENMQILPYLAHNLFCLKEALEAKNVTYEESSKKIRNATGRFVGNIYDLKTRTRL